MSGNDKEKRNYISSLISQKGRYLKKMAEFERAGK
jgi:hypothetical protein